MIYGPLIQDLTNPAAEFPAGSEDPLTNSAKIVSGFNSQLPLEDLEIALLPGMMTARLATCVLLDDWAASENDWSDDRDHLIGWRSKCLAFLRILLD